MDEHLRPGRRKINLYPYDCLLVDITLPGGSGLTLVQTLKSARSEAGIIIISARNSPTDKITGLEPGGRRVYLAGRQ